MNYLKANWPAPPNISAVTTLRNGGSSQPPYDSYNLGLHVGDQNAAVYSNRRALRKSLMLPAEPIWLEQVHSARCIEVETASCRRADAAVTRSSHHPLVIMTADCVPIILCDSHGTVIAAIHGGWRGLDAGIIESTLKTMSHSAHDLMAWVGPAICASCFEVGDEVYQAFVKKDTAMKQYFHPIENKWLGNLAGISEHILKSHGVGLVFQSHQCTFEQKKHFFSYRRQAQTGRMATLIWFK